MKQYLPTSLLNVSVSLESYCRAEIRHDLGY